MLCEACEQRLNQRGEHWVLWNCWRTDTDFPLRQTLAAATPVKSHPNGYKEFAATSIPAVDGGKPYFGASIFWRGCLHGWRGAGGNVAEPLDLGAYPEQLRLFLRDEPSFPAEAALVVTVGTSMEAARTGIAIFPWTKERQPAYQHHRFVVPGRGEGCLSPLYFSGAKTFFSLAASTFGLRS
jgi:hypothetical protein